MKFPLFILILAIILNSQSMASQIPQADYYVSVEGNDSWSGQLSAPNAARTDGPFATLQQARDAVQMTFENKPRKLKVLIRGGLYRLSETVVFSLKDSAGEQTITYEAYPGEKPVFSSGVSVGEWKKISSPLAGLPEISQRKVWVADVSGLKAFKTLFDGSQQLRRARGPGFSPQNVASPGNQGFQTLQFPAGAVADYSHLKEAELRIVPEHYWIMNLLPIQSVDQKTNTLVTALPGTYSLSRNRMRDRNNAWIENVIEVLDEPGEWVLDSSLGRLYFWPLSPSPSPYIVAPVLTELIRVEGNIDYDGASDVPVKGLTFRGITFTHGDRYPWHGKTGWGLQHDWECFDRPTGLVRFRGAERCKVVDCEFANSGHTAIRADLHCQEIEIVGNHIHHIAGVGVLLAGYGPGTKNVNRKNIVANNYIHHIGKEYWASAGIFAWQSGENRIAHNHIHHIPYTGIVVSGRINRSLPGTGECSRTIRWNEVPKKYFKWPWKKREPYLHGRKNIIEQNEIHNAMEMLGDGNGIYVSGTGGGNIVRFNFCHDCDSHYINAVIRCDDDQHETLIKGNICFRTGGYGEGIISKGNNDIINNVIADLQPFEHHRGHLVFPYSNITGSRIEKNILYSRRKGLLLYYQSQRSLPPNLTGIPIDRNLYFCTEDAHWADDFLKTQRTKGNERNSLQENPQFIDIDNNDFHFSPDSPAIRLGIQPLDARQMGLEKEYRKRHQIDGPRVRTRIKPLDQKFHKSTTVSITCDDSSAQLRYTLDGTEPSSESLLYKTPFKLTQPATVRAKGFSSRSVDLTGAKVIYAVPPAPILVDFESTLVGSVSPLASTYEDAIKKQYTVRVTEENAKGGKRSLRFTDGPGQKVVSTPYLYYRRRFETGVVTAGFDLFIDSKTVLSYQWRHYSSNYVTGPSILIGPGGVVSYRGKKLTVIPTHQWVRINILCLLGKEGTSQFELSIKEAQSTKTKVFKNLPYDTEFKRLDWTGLISQSKSKTVFDIDNIEIRSEN